MKIFFLLFLSFPIVAASKSGDPVHGKELFKTKGCITCHSLTSNGPKMAGPHLANVTKIRKHDWLKRWIKDPDSMRKDPIIKKFENQFPAPMPKENLSDQEVEDILAYLKKATAT